MANVFSKLLFATPSLGGAFSTLYTVPAGFVAVVRCVTAFNGNARTQPLVGFNLYLQPAGAIFCALGQPDARAARLFSWDLHTVIPAGGSIGGNSSSQDPPAWHVTCSGYELALP